MKMQCNKVKSILMSSPVLTAPDFQKQFKLTVAASDIGCGGVLLCKKVKIKLITLYVTFLESLTSTREITPQLKRMCLALLLELQHFDVNLGTTVYPVLVYTDLNPLTFIHRMKNRNQRLMMWSLTLQEYNLEIKLIKGKDTMLWLMLCPELHKCKQEQANEQKQTRNP